jgi:Tol biopolymer transport system component/DNA-binding winged helix-turn-helix (wHTH) protein
MLQECEKVRFGIYTADFNSAELKKGQDTVPLQNLPFRILRLLLRDPGRVVSREELRAELWPADTFVDFERGISTAISKLREALGDSASNPRFIETVGRRGYRFIAPVSSLATAAPGSSMAGAAAAAVATAREIAASRTVEQPPPISRRGRAVFVGVAVVVIAGALLAFDWIAQSGLPSTNKITQLTTSGKTEPAGGLFTDGARVFFLERSGARLTPMQTSIAGGDAVPMQMPFPDAILLAISPDKSQMLLRKRGDNLHKTGLWIYPIQGGTPQRVGDVVADSATWFPDGQRLLCSNDQEIFSVERDGSHRRHMADLDGLPFRFSWRPDGSGFRFSLFRNTDDITLWDASADGSNLHPVLTNWRLPTNACCGSWSPDGKSYVFRATQNGTPTGQEDLWLLHEPRSWPWQSKHALIRLTNGPTSFSEPVISADGKQIFTTGLLGQGYLAAYDQQHQVSRLSTPQDGFDLVFSHDQQWIAYIASPGHTLWRSRIDGSDRLALTTLPLNAVQPRWSADDKQILFMGATSKDQHTAYIVNGDGSGLHKVMENDTLYRAIAEWSPDQHSIVVGDSFSEKSAERGILLINLADHSTQEIPGSKGLNSPAWSPNGDYLAAASQDFTRIMLLNTHTRQWKQLARMNSFYRIWWERDGSRLLVQDARSPAQAVFSIDPATGHAEQIANCEPFLREGATWCGFQGRSPEGALLFAVATSWANVYRFDVELR